MKPILPKSCDTFVVMSNKTKDGKIIFGKNSDRPNGEVQEVIYRKGAKYADGLKLKCTYMDIKEASETYSVILSKPSWMWGAEMGANEHGVCIGNEAIWTKVDIESDKKLLGMDLVRLGLERGKSARHALDIICDLLEEYGQGGSCSNIDDGLMYHNSYLIVDNKEAWVLETAAKFWAAERVTEGYRNISNCLSIGKNMDLMSTNLKENLKAAGFWDGDSVFDFTACLSEDHDDRSRFQCGEKLLSSLSSEGKFSLTDMFEVLRDTESHICRGLDDGFPTMGSMVSALSPASVKHPHCHWFTGTPNPKLSVFKPFIFTPNATISPYIQCDPKKEGVAHLLYRRQTVASSNTNEELQKTLRAVEQKCVEETQDFTDNFSEDRLSEVDDLFKDCVESELKFY